jgi:hypothetical protein
MHGAALVNEYVYANVLFFDELPEHEPLKPRVDIPVNVAKIIARFILPEIRELYGRTPARRATLAAHSSGECAPGLYPQTFELS